MTDAQIRSTIIIVGTVLFIVVLMILLRTVRTKEHNQHLHVQKNFVSRSSGNLRDMRQVFRT